MVHVVRRRADGRQVRDAVAGEVADRHRFGDPAGGKRPGVTQGAILVAEQDSDNAVEAAARCDHVGPAVGIEVRDRQTPTRDAVLLPGREAALAVPQQHLDGGS